MMDSVASRFPAFLPPETVELVEPAALDLLSGLERRVVSVKLSAEPESSLILSSLVRSGAFGTTQPPILLCHGFDSSVLEYRRLLPLLAVRREVWAIDLLGFGFTDRPEGLVFSQAALRAHLIALWEQLIGRPVVLVGASMGGALAQSVAIACPEMVDRLVLLDSAGFVDKPWASRFLVPPLGQLATAILASPRVRQNVSRRAYADPDRCATLDAYRCGALHLKMPRWSEALISFTQQGGCTITADRIAQITQPTLILWGDRDRILGTDLALRFQQTLQNSQLVWVKNCGHVPHLEQPEFTAAQILAH